MANMEVQKWAIYGRVSTDHENQKTSIPNQLNYCTEWVHRSGGVVYDTYIDDGLSGKSMLIRPDVQRLLADAEAKKFCGVVFNNISRFGRDNLDLLWMKRKICDEWDLRMIGLEEGYDSSKDDDELLFMIHAGMSQSMRKKLSKQIRHGCIRKAERGEFAIPTPPYGYRRPRIVIREDGTVIRPENYKLLIDPDTAPIVRKIFELVKHGLGAHLIIAAMENGNPPFDIPIPTRFGAERWSKSTIFHILHNPAYKGTIIFNQTKSKTKKNPESEWIIHENAHEAIVSKKLWDEVQEIIGRRRTNKALGTNRALLSGIAKCGLCGKGMIHASAKAASGTVNMVYKRYFYYRCIHGHLTEKDSMIQIREEVLNEVILNALQEISFDLSLVDSLVSNQKENLHGQSMENDKEIKKIDKELTKIEKAFRKDLELYRAEGITINQFKDLQAENTLARENLMRRRALLEQSHSLEESLEGRVKYVKEKLARFSQVDKSDHAQLKMFISDVVEKVVVNSKTDVEIYYRGLNQDLPVVSPFLVRV
ncbi:resolvase, N terminal domain protein [Desulfosporosinus sp. OT]|nr:resolvase, N terminal domain protein [Desulfosporosinus sp. OT]